MRLKSLTTCLLLLATSLAAQSASPADSSARLDRLAQSLSDFDFVTGVDRGWEGDQRLGSWVTRCDQGNAADACWLVGVELAPFLTVGLSASNRVRYDYVTEKANAIFISYANILGVRYLQRGCDLGSAQACADLGDYHRFRGMPTMGEKPDRFDPKRAFKLYQRACELSSAYGCYLVAEFTDRGIGTTRNPEAAHAQFAELCHIVTVACGRMEKPAAAYPYKTFSPLDSSCRTAEECWTDCLSGVWGACRTLDWSTVIAMPNQPAIAAAVAKACSEGSDWGCSHSFNVVGCAGDGCFSGASPEQKKAAKALAVKGCQAGSELACRTACKTADSAGLGCATRFRTIAGVEFQDKSLPQRMQECFGGGARGCFDFLENGTSVTMTPDEDHDYKGSDFLFNRMKCNAGYGCRELVEYFGRSQLAWAYQLSDNTTAYATSPLSQSLTPMERALSVRWLMNASISALLPVPENVMTGLEEMCRGGLARACMTAAEYYEGKAFRIYPLGPSSPQALDSMFASHRKSLEKSLKDSHASCDGLPAQWVGTITIEQSPERSRCHEKATKYYDEMKAVLESQAALSRTTTYSVYEYDPALKAKAVEYWLAGCKAGYGFACEAYEKLSMSPDRIVK